MKTILKGALRRVGIRRSNVATARLCCERYALATFGRRRERHVGRILCYHSVGQPAWGVNDVSPSEFRRHLELALSAGFRFVPASELARTGGGPKDLAITFDDGLKSVLSHAAPILAEYRVPWSAFVVSEWSEHGQGWPDGTFLNWNDVERLASLGAEIGSHSATHPDFKHLGLAQTQDELGVSRRMLKDRVGIETSSFAIPFGQSKNWPALAAKAARDVGYDVVYAQAEETRPAGTVARTFVTRFDSPRIFRALLGGTYDRWEEWF
ncbi:MAG TPA: polysaccharide deacetylase family protein [Polyangiaceae bacterium]|nr:polysaccharide deacetylase family protein [Polyangiaceae bacterium]